MRMRQGLLISKRLRTVALAVVAVGLLLASFGAALPTAFAAPRVPTGKAIAQVWVWPGESPQYFCDYLEGNCTEAIGGYGFNCGCPPNTVYSQYMGVTIKLGQFYGLLPGTRVEEYINANYTATYYIQVPGCVSTGWPDATICGDNYQHVNWGTVWPQMRHFWVAVDGSGYGYSGYWDHLL